MGESAVTTGLERLLATEFAALTEQGIGLLVHPASVDRHLRHAVQLFLDAPQVDLKCLFGPQHGIRGETQDNMIEWEGYRDPATGLPVYSLYGTSRRPTAEMLDDIDTLVIDLQDVGARYYTFAWTLLLCLEACAQAGKRVVVLDRPNPLGGVITEGTILDMAYRSFVGMAPIPMRHSLTMGELACYFQDRFAPDVELEVVWMTGWRRALWFDETGQPWVPPSPNMPTLETACAYPGFCLLEGTCLSEGRGTTRPFEILGAPFIDPDILVRRLCAWELPGCIPRPLYFQPTFQKHAGQLCGGVQWHVTDRNLYRPVLVATAVLAAVRELYPREFQWQSPPYEYESILLPIDILAGGQQLRQEIDAGRSPLEIVASWEEPLSAFAVEVQEIQHYD